MPVLNGYKATEQLRSQAYTVPIIALTAHTVDEVKQKCITAGYTDVISKPFDVSGTKYGGRPLGDSYENRYNVFFQFLSCKLV
ncbi:MAG: response regulator [Bdellovibrionaceae bacterium]|nr:response regulator [Bdellovibrio sp.]